MYCKKCGKKITNDSDFCPYCGAKQTASAKSAEIEQPAPVYVVKPKISLYERAQKCTKYSRNLGIANSVSFVIEFIFLLLITNTNIKWSDIGLNIVLVIWYIAVLAIGILTLVYLINIWVGTKAIQHHTKAPGKLFTIAIPVILGSVVTIQMLVGMSLPLIFKNISVYTVLGIVLSLGVLETAANIVISFFMFVRMKETLHK